MFDSPYTFLALTVFLFSIPIEIFTGLLMAGIARDRSSTNRVRWFNSIFLYFVGGNLAFSLILSNLLPLIVPDTKKEIFIIFSGISINDGVWGWFVKLIYAVIMGLLSYLTFIPVISMFLRWIVHQKVLSTKWLQRSYTLTYFHLSAIPFFLFTYSFRFINKENDKEHYELRVAQLMGQKFPFIVMDSTFYLLLVTVFGTFLLSALMALLWHIMFVQSTAHVQNEVTELGYQDSALITKTFLSLVVQTLLFVTLPHLFLALSIYLEWNLGLKAIPIGLFMMLLPLTSSLTIYMNFKQYKEAIQKSTTYFVDGVQ